MFMSITVGKWTNYWLIWKMDWWMDGWRKKWMHQLNDGLGKTIVSCETFWFVVARLHMLFLRTPKMWLSSFQSDFLFQIADGSSAWTSNLFFWFFPIDFVLLGSVCCLIFELRAQLISSFVQRLSSSWVSGKLTVETNCFPTTAVATHLTSFII